MRVILLALVCIFGVPIVGCGSSDEEAPEPLCVGTLSEAVPNITVQLRFVGDDGGAVPNVSVALVDTTVVASAEGVASVSLAKGPAVAIASANGFLAEPILLGLEDDKKEITVRLWSDRGGARFVMHSVGDVMLGRRYEAPVAGEPLVPAGDAAKGAQHVIENVRRAFLASDVRTLNLETAVSDRPETQAAPGKRFILRTRPSALAGIKDLATNVILANNHVRDYRDEGVADTLAALDGAGIRFVGAATTDVATPALVADVRGKRVGLLAWTTIDGSFVNDSYPKDGEPIDASPKEAWQYEPREWGFTGTAFTVPKASRRIGSAWKIFDDAETKGLSVTDASGGWASIAGVYPELQDWVARRGHGGAARWNDSASTAAIAEAKKSSDLVVVQLHAGFQFQEAASVSVEKIAQLAIDAGADIVIAHHPHVLQGLSFYKGKLIAYSLGNFIFDQDFLSTFSSVMLRTIWEGRTLLEARLLPVEIDRYRPAFSTGAAARATLRRIWERSVLAARSERTGSAVRAYVAEPAAGAVPARLLIERNTARVVPDAPVTTDVVVHVEAGATSPIDFAGLVDPRLGLAAGSGDDVQVGRDVFGWGRFEDDLADNAITARTHWDIGTCDEDVAGGAAATGLGHLRLRRKSTNKDRVSSRPVARIPLSRHRFYSADGKPLDPDATYSLRLSARRSGDGEPSLKLDFYAFDDTDPTEDPTSEVISSSEIPLDVRDDGAWHVIDVVVGADKLGANARANMLLVYVRLAPASRTTKLDIDELKVIEWRSAARARGVFGIYDFVKSEGPRDLRFPGILDDR